MPSNPSEIAKCVEKSREWNKENQAEVYKQFTNQCLKTKSTNSSVKKTETDEEEGKIEYVYSYQEDWKNHELFNLFIENHELLA